MSGIDQPPTKPVIKNLPDGRYELHCPVCGESMIPPLLLPIDAFTAYIKRFEAAHKILRQYLEQLTPGGSEFHNSPEICFQWVQQRLSVAGKVAAERNLLREENERLEQRISDLTQSIMDRPTPAQMAELQAQLKTARQILVEICNVVGACTADVSLFFLAHLPGEVKAQLEKLTTQHQTAVRAAAAALAEKDTLLKEIAWLQAELAKLKGETS